MLTLSPIADCGLRIADSRGLPCGCKGAAGALQGAGLIIKRPAKELRLWGSLMRQRAGIQKAYQRVMDRELTKAKEECLVKLHHAGQKSILQNPIRCLISQRAVAADFLFDLANFTRGMQAGVRAVGAEGLQTAGQQLYDEIGYADPFRFPPKEVVEFLAARQNKLKNVPQGIYDRIRVVIQDKIETGRPIAEIASEIAANVGVSLTRSASGARPS
jgi:hypothetical protein